MHEQCVQFDPWLFLEPFITVFVRAGKILNNFFTTFFNDSPALIIEYWDRIMITSLFFSDESKFFLQGTNLFLLLSYLDNRYVTYN